MGSGLNEPVHCGLNEPVAKLVRFYCKPSVNVLMLVKGVPVILQQRLKQVLLKHCDCILSSLEVVGTGVQ